MLTAADGATHDVVARMERSAIRDRRSNGELFGGRKSVPGFRSRSIQATAAEHAGSRVQFERATGGSTPDRDFPAKRDFIRVFRKIRPLSARFSVTHRDIPQR
jgi:hypothetical protein